MEVYGTHEYGDLEGMAPELVFDFEGGSQFLEFSQEITGDAMMVSSS